MEIPLISIIEKMVKSDRVYKSAAKGIFPSSYSFFAAECQKTVGKILLFPISPLIIGAEMVWSGPAEVIQAPSTVPAGSRILLHDRRLKG